MSYREGVSRVVATRVIDAPVGVVWEVFTDVSRRVSALSGVAEVALLTPGPLRVHTRWRETRTDPSGATVTEELVVTSVDPGRSATIALAGTGENQLTYQELLSGAESSRTEKRRNRLAAEFHFRFAMSISALLLAAFAAPFGIALRIRNRAVVFLAGILVMMALYLPLVAVARAFAERGVAPAWVALQAPNVILAAIAAVFIRKVNHP